jgi:putative selenium metabolism hydrolase
MDAFYAAMRDEYVEFAKKVTSFRSLPGEEKPLADFFLKEFDKLGVEAFRDGAGNVLAVLRGRGGGPNVMLNGHLDIVPEGELKNWEPYSPFEATLVDGELIGRGLADLKGGLCAQFFAFRQFALAAKKGVLLSGDLLFALVTMEEPAESMGTEYLFDVTMKELNLSCDLVYLSEPTSGDLALGHRGKVELVVDVFGKTAHSSQPKEGISAVEKAIPVLNAVFDAFGDPPDIHPLLGESSMTVTDMEVRPGGLSVIPDLCRIYVDRRYVPPKTTADCVEQIKAFIQRQKTRDPEFSARVYPRTTLRTCYTGYTKEMERKHPAWITQRDHPFVEASFKALRQIDQNPQEKYWKFGTDGSITKGAHGIPTIGYSMAEERWAHQPKERVNVDGMLSCIEGYAAMLSELYGISPKDIQV